MAGKPKPGSEKDLSIEAYRAKRDFGKTPEPAPEAPREGAGKAFVIHRHEARSLHYDLRLEMKGVLKSFAVPKGFSWVPEHKHLAVRTEDHPIEYLRFDGVIPKGEYGAGTMTIWDSGTYEMVEGFEGPKSLEDGELKFELDGGRLRGQWHMVKTSQGPNDWLLFKHRDRYARGEDDPDFPLDLSRVERAAPPRTPKAMRAAGTSSPFSDPEWLFELRFPGRRLLAVLDGDSVRWHDEAGRRVRDDPGLEPAFARVRCRRAVIDGVLVANDGNGRPDGRLLARRLEEREVGELLFYAFDLPYWESWDLRGYPLLERKRALASILPESDRLLYVDHVMERGEELHEVVQNGGLWGVMAKEAASVYRAGRSKSWREIPAKAAPKAAGKNVLDSLSAPRRKRKSRVPFKNRDKIYWPGEGITKGQLLDYYERIADVLLPYLRNRPLHTLRYPEGIEDKSFYQKDLTGHIPDWVETAQVREEDGKPVRYVVCNDRDTLLYLINLGSIDLHPWSSRIDDLDRPDWAILDLDPSDSEFAKVVRIAQHVGKLLRGAGLRPVVKTSGATGMHIYVPVNREYTYEQVRMFCEAVARMTVKEHPKIATVERAVAKREDRVYVDFGQNRKEQTVVPPYIVRPVPGACVSTPLDWDEVSSDLDPRAHTIFTLPDRLDRRGDLFRGAVSDPQDLGPAVEALSEL